MKYVWLLWFWEDLTGSWGDWQLIGVFDSLEEAQQIANKENYPMFQRDATPVWGGAREWQQIAYAEHSAKDKGIGAWNIQKTLVNSINQTPEAPEQVQP